MPSKEICNVKVASKVLEKLTVCMEYDNSLSFVKRNRGDYLYELLSNTDFENINHIPLEVMKLEKLKKTEKSQISANVKVRSILRDIKELTGLSHSSIITYAVLNASMINEMLESSVHHLEDVNNCNKGIIVGGNHEGKTYYGIRPLYEDNESVVLLTSFDDAKRPFFKEDDSHKVFTPSGWDAPSFTDEQLKEIERYLSEHETKMVLIDETWHVFNFLRLDMMLSFLEKQNLRVFLTSFPYKFNKDVTAMVMELLWKRGYETILLGGGDHQCASSVSFGVEECFYKFQILEFLEWKKNSFLSICHDK